MLALVPQGAPRGVDPRRTTGRRLVLALAVALMGVVDIASAWLSHPAERLSALVHLVPTSVLDTSRTFTLLAGTLLLVTAWGLARGKRRSFVLALFLCALSVPVNMLKAFDFEEATVAVGLMFALGVSADAFRVRSRDLTWAGFRSGALWAIGALIAYALAGSWLLGVLIDHDISAARVLRAAAWSGLGIGSPLTIVPPALPMAGRRIAEWYLRSLPLLSVTVLVGLMLAGLRPASHRRRHGLQMERVAGILREHGDSTVSSYALSADTDWFFSRTGSSFVAYRDVSGVILGIGDPIGPATELPSLLEDFAAYAETHDWTPAFFQASPEHMALYRSMGWRALHIGEDPILAPDGFTLEGSEMGDVRRAVNKASRDGLEIRFFHPQEHRFDPAGGERMLFEQMREISAQWLSQHPGGEMGFCMGRFSAERLQSTRLAVAVQAPEGRVEGFVTWEPVWARRGWTLDLMRRRHDAAPGTMESLIVASVDAARTRGDAVLSLGLSALANVPRAGSAPEEPGSDGAREFLRTHLSGFYDFDGLFHWKRKFAPAFEDRFLVYPSALALPRVLLALVRAQSPGGLSSLLRRAMTGWAVLLALALPAVARAHPPDRILSLEYAAPLLNQRHRDVRVHLPPSYNLGAAANRRYPVVYLLHGFPGRASDWLGRGNAAEIADSLARSGAIPEVILVCPDGNRGFFGRSLWTDRWDGSFPLAQSFVRELVPWIDSTFRTLPDARHRALIGLSDGATGGLDLLLRNPGVFSAWGGHSGAYRLQMDFGMGSVVGSGPDATDRLNAMSPLETLAGRCAIARACVLYFDCGDEDESLGGNRELHSRLDSLGIAHEWHEFPGSHTWGYWRKHLHRSLVAVCGAMRTESAQGPPDLTPGSRAAGR